MVLQVIRIKLEFNRTFYYNQMGMYDFYSKTAPLSTLSYFYKFYDFIQFNV